MDHLPRHIGQSERAPLKRIGKLLMIKTKLVQNSSLYIEGIDLTTHGTVTNLISFAVGMTFFDAATGHPYGKRIGMMIPAIVWILHTISVFHHGCAAKLATPNNQCFI